MKAEMYRPDKCSNCGTELGDDTVSLGMYGVRGVYCSHLCAYTCQPGWVDFGKATDDLRNKLDIT
ncbi:MAG: hypothetical protein ABEK10_03630 [Candidatus Nanosalina sp.]